METSYASPNQPVDHSIQLGINRLHSSNTHLAAAYLAVPKQLPEDRNCSQCLLQRHVRDLRRWSGGLSVFGCPGASQDIRWFQKG